MRYSYDTETLEEQVFGDGWDEGAAEEQDEDEEEGEAPEFLDTDAPVKMTVTLEDGMQAEYTVAGVFLEGEKEYIALETPEGDIHIMELSEGEEDEVRLLPVEEKEEQERAIEAFRYYFDFEGAEPENQGERENNDDRDQDREED